MIDSLPPANVRRDSYDIIVLSASAGGIVALHHILSALPESFAVPIIVVLHHAPGRSAILAKVLARRSNLPIVAVRDGEPLVPGKVYLAPADRHLSVTGDYTLTSGDGRRINFLRSSSEPLLDSIVSLYGSRAIAVVLTGSGRNGARGARHLHDAGGMVLAQDRASSMQFGMPSAAIQAGAVDMVLPLDAIAPTLLELTHQRGEPVGT